MKAGQETYDIFYPPMAAALGVFGWTVLLRIFQTRGVKYREVLGLGNYQFLTAFRSFVLTVVMVVCDVGLLIWHLKKNRSIPVAIAAYFLPLVYVGIMYLMNRNSLTTLCQTMWAILLLKVPGFREVFFTDLVTSLSKVLSDMVGAIFTMVYLYGGKESVFGPRAYFKLVTCLVVTCIPFFYRLIQSLMVGYIDPRERRQFLNALKHALNMTIIILSSLKNLIKNETLWWEHYGKWWLFAAIVNTFLSFGWDLLVDWDARSWTWQNNAPNVRSRIIVNQKQKQWYIVIVVLDLIGRGCWIARLSFHTFANPWIMLALTITEILRRVIWIMMRIEAQVEVTRRRWLEETRQWLEQTHQHPAMTRQQPAQTHQQPGQTRQQSAQTRQHLVQTGQWLEHTRQWLEQTRQHPAFGPAQTFLARQYSAPAH